jgi:hypothetical protein
MGDEMSRTWERKGTHLKFWWGSWKERNQNGDLGVVVRIRVEWSLEKQERRHKLD